MGKNEQLMSELLSQYEFPEDLINELRLCCADQKVQQLINETVLKPIDLVILNSNKVIHVLHPKVISCIQENVPQELRMFLDHVASNPADFEVYRSLLEEIRRFSKLPRSKRNDRKIALQDISVKIDKIRSFIVKSKIPCFELSNLSNDLTLFLNSELKWLQHEATEYFEQFLSQQKRQIKNITFLPKVDGVQLGNRMLIRYLDNSCVDVPSDSLNQIIYFIKTHQLGSLREGNSTMVSVDFKELLIYKVLEYSGYGPKAHFFFNPISPSAFYIATQDEGFTKKQNNSKFFKTYGQDKPRLDELSQSDELDELTKRELTRIDIFLRLFSLWDITLNPGNYGYINIDGFQKWRVIDFRVDTLPRYELENIFENYYKGEGLNGYLGLPKILNTMGLEERLKLCGELINDFENGRLCHNSQERKDSLTAAVFRAYSFCEAYLKRNSEMLQLDFLGVFEDLTRYKDGIVSNINKFIESVSKFSWQENDSSISPKFS